MLGIRTQMEMDGSRVDFLLSSPEGNPMEFRPKAQRYQEFLLIHTPFILLKDPDIAGMYD